MSEACTLYFVGMDALTQFELLVIAGSLIGIWIKHQSDYSSLKGGHCLGDR